MSRNNTGNPLGSKAFLDFEDNVRNLDEAVNGTESAWVDRFGRTRKPLQQMEREFDSAQAYRESRFNDFIASSGYQFIGDYGPGIEITEYNQLVRDENGEFWRVSGQVELPYVTTGAGIPEDDALVPAGDAVLRQDLSDPDNGAAMVGYRRSLTLAARKVSDRLSDQPISIADASGVDPSGVTDSTAGIQQAYDEAQATGRALYIPNGRYLCNELLLNNNAQAAHSGEKVVKIFGPGVIVNTNTVSPMIKKNPASPFTRSQLFLFKDVTFEDAPGGAFALVDGDSIIRTLFDGVHFYSVNRAIYAEGLLQTFYFTNCIIRRGAGWFIDANNMYDVRMSSNIIEHRENVIRTRSTTADPAANGVVITNNLIEGLTGKAIELGACFGVSITNNYFEQNSGYIDCSISTAFHKGLTITGNSIQTSPAQNADPDFYPIKWGKTATKGLTSGGNTSTGNLHDPAGATAYIHMDGDSALGKLYKDYENPTVIGRTPVGYAQFSDGPTRYYAWNNRLLMISPAVAGFGYQGGPYGDEVNGEIAPVWHLFGTTNPGTTPATYGTRRWGRGSYVSNSTPSELGVEGSKYVIKGWVCVTAGQGGHNNGTDRWVADRGLTGN